MAARVDGRRVTTPAPALVTIPYTLVWIDSERAHVARWSDGPQVMLLLSDVPSHRHSTGRTPIDPWTGRGAGRAQAAIDAQRNEHLARFVATVAEKIGPLGPVEIVGPGPVRDHLRRAIVEVDERSGRARTVTSAPAAPMTERQLVARLRSRVGAELPRQASRGAG